MRSLLYSFAFITLLFYSAQQASAASAVLGIDLGTEYTKAVIVKAGIPQEIVLTKDSKRKELSAIAFKAPHSAAQDDSSLPERLYGGDALALAPRIPGDVYPNLKHLLGLAVPYGDLAVQDYKKRYPALDLVEDVVVGTYGFRSKSFGSDAASFSIEELLGMELRGIKENAETMAGPGSSVRDVVVSIPGFYTAEERQAVETAVELAGLKAVGLISDNLAVGLNYAMPRTFDSPGEHHLVYDMGAGSTTASVLKFEGKTVKDVGRFNKTVQEVSVLGSGWDRSLGGDALNDLIVNDMVAKFVQSSDSLTAQVDPAAVRIHGRAMAKLNREAERVRQVLSANTATVITFEGLYEDIDFKYNISRAEFESLASAYISRVGEPITQALKQAGIKVSDLDSIILHGGAVRTPFVQSALEEIVQDPGKLKSNVNADEAAVFGAAFKAASLSPSFRVKEIRTKELATYPVTVHWVSNDKEKKQNIFVPTSSTGVLKQMPFNMLGDFDFSVSQNIQDPTSEEPILKPVLEVKVMNLSASVEQLVMTHGCARGNISVAMGFQIDSFTGLPIVTRGTASCESDEADKNSNVLDDVKGFFGFGGKKEKPLGEVEGEEELEVEMLPEETVESSTSTAKKSKKTGAAAGKEEKVAATKLHTFNLDLETKRLGSTNASKDELKRVKDRLLAFDKSDQSRRQREDVFNKLEGFTYRVRDMLTETGFMDVSSLEQRTAIETLLGTTSEWLSMEGAQASYDMIKEKLLGLTSLVDPIQKRRTEIVSRPRSIESLQEALNQTQSIMRLVRDQVDNAAASASAAAASAVSAAESVFESITDAAGSAITGTPSSDDLNDLDSSTSTTASPSSSASPYTLPNLSIFTEDDYSRLSSTYESVKDWITTQSSAQDLLSVFDDPVLSTTDIERKTQQLSQLTNELLRRLTKPKPTSSFPSYKPHTSKSSTSKTSNSKSDASKTRGGGFKIPTPKIEIVPPKGAKVEDEGAAVVSPSPVVKEQAEPAETVAQSVLVDEETSVPEPEPVEVVGDAKRDEL